MADLGSAMPCYAFACLCKYTAVCIKSSIECHGLTSCCGAAQAVLETSHETLEELHHLCVAKVDTALRLPLFGPLLGSAPSAA